MAITVSRSWTRFPTTLRLYPRLNPAYGPVERPPAQRPDDFTLDGDGPRRLTIAGGRYVVLVHTGPYAELERPYRWLFGEWLPASGEEAADAPPFEEYLNDPRTLPPSQWRTAICMPLR